MEAAQSTAAVIRTGSVALSTLLVTGTVSVVAGLAFLAGPEAVSSLKRPRTRGQCLARADAAFLRCCCRRFEAGSWFWVSFKAVGGWCQACEPFRK